MRVLVVGAGIAGLSTARALGHVGIDCDVVEREQDWTGDGLGIYLPANAVRALRLLEIQATAAGRSAVIPRQRFLDHRGRMLMEIDLADVWGNDDPCLAMPRSALHEALRDGLAQPVRMGTTITSLRTDQDHAKVTFVDGTTVSYDLVIGADGIHSHTRRLVVGDGPDEVVRPVGQMAWRFVTECPAEVTSWSVMLGRGLTFLAIPIGADWVYCYADASTSHPENADLASQFAAFAEPVPQILASLDGAPVHRSVIEEVVLSQWVFGRVLLIGDAAHATSPNMAQGAAMAMEDAFVLARYLRGTRDIDAGLAQFQLSRRARTDWVRDQTHRRDHTRRLPPVVRNMALRFAGRRIFRANYAPLVPPP